MNNTFIQGKSKEIINTKTFNYIRNAIQMSTQYFTFGFSLNYVQDENRYNHDLLVLAYSETLSDSLSYGLRET